jgi:hypothetical protein
MDALSEGSKAATTGAVNTLVDRADSSGARANSSSLDSDIDTTADTTTSTPEPLAELASARGSGFGGGGGGLPLVTRKSQVLPVSAIESRAKVRTIARRTSTT